MEHRIQGFFFEDFGVGDEFHSQSRRISEADILQYAEMTGDKNRIHTDPVFAASSIFGERVAHGLLGLSLVGGLAVETGFAKDTAVALRRVEWKFSKAVKIGDVLQASFVVTQKKDMAGYPHGMIKFKVTVKNQNGSRVMSGSWRLLIMKKQRI